MTAKAALTFVSIALVISSRAASAPATPTNSVREGPQVIAPHSFGVGRLVPDMELAPVSGKPFRLSELKPAKAIVLAFTSTSCPLSKRYLPTLAKLEREYAERGVRFVFVDPLLTDTEAQIASTIREHGFHGDFIRDTNREIRNMLGARSKTEAFVLDAARTLVYRGAVDDQYGLGYSLDAPRHDHLAEALEAALANKTPRVSATTAPGCVLEVATKKTIDTSIDFHSRISRIVQQHCQECHHAGDVAPFALETYDDVASHAGMISRMVEKDLMPPWFAAPTAPGHTSPWANDRTLPAEDKRDLLAWIAEGKKEGNPSDAPLPRTFTRDWQIGTPDAVIQIPTPLAVKATGKMPYQNVFVETAFDEDRWVQALEVRPTAREVVHHVLVFIVPKQTNATATATNSTARRRRARQDEGGNYFAAYVPGNNVLQYDSGFAKLLPKGATLQFQIHYTPNGTATTDQTRLGLVFAKEPPRHEVRVVGIANPLLRIPPGTDNYEVPAATPVLFDAKVLSFMPHMHLRGKAFRYELARPDGSKQLLLDVPRYDFNWQLQYKLIQPIDAPLGSRLLATGWYDNSTNNPANPDPTREVRWGPQTDDEMMLGYLEYYVPGLKPGDKTSLTQAVRDGALMFNVLDKNRDGKITLNEAPSAASFRQADVDADGVVTRDELKNFIQRTRR